MVLGLSLPVFALLHVIISLVGIFAGLVVVGGFMSGKLLRGWTGLFLVTTIVTNVTGFFFPVVPKGQARIRTQMSAAHSPAEIDAAIDAFRSAGKSLGVI